jgi:predicted RNA-binding Zn-ribbon protein involved in translation (DUF1610 family)
MLFMGLSNWLRDSVENVVDSVGRITGGYKYWENCNRCGTKIDVKYGYDCFKCENCGYILCNNCANSFINVKVLNNPGLFRKGRRQLYIICPSCGQKENGPIEEFRR